MELGDIIITLLLLICSGFHLAKADHWAYDGDNGPDQWPDLCKKGKRQSPIDIVTDETLRTDLGSLKFIKYDFAFSGKATNTGHSIQIELSGVPIRLSGANLPSTYILEQMHFHWGAEHTIDGERDALELHYVHYDKHYGNFSNAVKHSHGVAVVAVLFKMSHRENHELDGILKAAESVSAWVGQSTVEIKSKIIPSLFLPKDHSSYYYYEGSLTTPLCQESVLWYIMSEELTVSEKQVAMFREISTDKGPLKHNFRPTQDLNGRKVYHHLEGFSAAPNTTSNILYSIFSAFLIIFLQRGPEQLS